MAMEDEERRFVWYSMSSNVSSQKFATPQKLLSDAASGGLRSAGCGADPMGCGGSKSDAEPTGFTAAGPAPAPAEDAAIVDQIAEELKKAKSASRMSVATEGAAQQLFRDYRRRSETARRSDSSSGSGSAGSPERIDRKGLRRMLSTVPDDQFDFLWPLFDAKGTGLVEPDEFVMTLGMLKDPNMSTERRVEVCFFMFDTNKTGTLSREEFRAMIQATVNVNLYDLLQTKTGEEGFEKHLQSEYSQENLAFYKAVQAFAKNAAAGDGDAAKAAKDIVQKYVKEGAEEQVNLPGPTTKRCLEKVAAVEAAGGGGAAWADVFKEAEAEIFKLMERDTCARPPVEPTTRRMCHTRPAAAAHTAHTALAGTSASATTRRRSTSSSPNSSRRPTPRTTASSPSPSTTRGRCRSRRSSYSSTSLAASSRASSTSTRRRRASRTRTRRRRKWGPSPRTRPSTRPTTPPRGVRATVRKRPEPAEFLPSAGRPAHREICGGHVK